MDSGRPGSRSTWGMLGGLLLVVAALAASLLVGGGDGMDADPSGIAPSPGLRPRPVTPVLPTGQESAGPDADRGSHRAPLGPAASGHALVVRVTHSWRDLLPSTPALVRVPDPASFVPERDLPRRSRWQEDGDTFRCEVPEEGTYAVGYWARQGVYPNHTWRLDAHRLVEVRGQLTEIELRRPAPPATDYVVLRVFDAVGPPVTDPLVASHVRFGSLKSQERLSPLRHVDGSFWVSIQELLRSDRRDFDAWPEGARIVLVIENGLPQTAAVELRPGVRTYEVTMPRRVPLVVDVPDAQPDWKRQVVARLAGADAHGSYYEDWTALGTPIGPDGVADLGELPAGTWWVGLGYPGRTGSFVFLRDRSRLTTVELVDVPVRITLGP